MDDADDTPVADPAAADELIDFTPDPAQLARPAAATPAPTWLAASIAVTIALLLGVSLAVRPAVAVAHGATGDASAADATPSAHQDLFQLPAWHDEDKTTVADAR